MRMAGDNPVEERTGADYEFLSKPRWQRVLIAFAGPAMNILLAFLIFWGIFWLVGVPSEDYLAQPADVVAVLQATPATARGVQAGDRIIAINGVNTPTWEKVFDATGSRSAGHTVHRHRFAQRRRMKRSARRSQASRQHRFRSWISADAGCRRRRRHRLPAEKARDESRATMIAIDGKPIVTWYQLTEKFVPLTATRFNFVVRRDGQDVPIAITPMQGMGADGRASGKLAYPPKMQTRFEREGFVPAVKDAALQTASAACARLARSRRPVHRQSFNPRIAKRRGHRARIRTGRQTRPVDLLGLMAVISLNLGLLNLLPIPMLDGGHVLLLAIEGILRRDLSVAVKERFVQVGLVFLLGIFAFVMYSDILKLVQHH